MHLLDKCIEQLNAVDVVSARSLPQEYKVFLFGELLRRFNRYLAIHRLLLLRALAHVAVVARHILAIQHLVLYQTVLHQAVLHQVFNLGVLLTRI